MAFPLNSHQGSSPVSAGRQNRPLTGCRSNPQVQGGDTPGQHQLEKLEFALAVALTRGDLNRSHDLRRQIDALGGNCEEPGT